jgi:Lrp/AsnC family transcriptional regulator for asnA, asnC and gidA
MLQSRLLRIHQHDGMVASDMALDSLDRRLISCLKLDGRMSYSELAGRLGVSEGTARNRLGKLVASGALKIVPVVEPDRIGYRLNMWIGVRCRPGAARTVAEGLARFHAVRYATACAGVYDVICEAVFLSQAEMLGFLESELQTVDGITSAETSLVLEIAKAGWEWELREEDARSAARRDREGV